jgi:hypothetical protein
MNFDINVFNWICDTINLKMTNNGYNPNNYIITNNPFSVKRKDGNPLSIKEGKLVIILIIPIITIDENTTSKFVI